MSTQFSFTILKSQPFCGTVVAPRDEIRRNSCDEDETNQRVKKKESASVYPAQKWSNIKALFLRWKGRKAAAGKLIPPGRRALMLFSEEFRSLVLFFPELQHIHARKSSFNVTGKYA